MMPQDETRPRPRDWLIYGPAGAGKTTLIETSLPRHEHVDVINHFPGPGLPAPGEEERIRAGYENLSVYLADEVEAPVAVEVGVDWPFETLPPVALRLHEPVLLPVHAPLYVCEERNQAREGRTAPVALVKRHCRVDLDEVTTYLRGYVGHEREVPARA